MNDSRLQSALREWRAHITKGPVIAVILGVAVLLCIIGPFGSNELLRPVPRFGYWVCIVIATYSVGFILNGLMAGTGPVSTSYIRSGLRALATAIAVTGVVIVLNGLILGYWPAITDLPLLLANVIAIAFVVSVLFEIVSHQQASVETPGTPATAPLLDRLSFEKRGALLSLSVEDHYVNVRTSKGTEMVLMRLSDAIRETGSTAGLQVHRSHWVALDAIKQVRKKGDGAILTLHDQTEVPVSRSNMSAIKEAGFFPKASDG